MTKLATAVAALVLAALPFIASAGVDPGCPDYTGDSRVTAADILYVLDRYQTPRPGGGVFNVIDLLETVQAYGNTCA
jgi:hypothetical protein